MILQLDIARDKNNKIKDQVSQYQPTDKEREAILCIMKDYSHSNYLMTRSYREFNDFSLINRLDRDKSAFNTFIASDGDVYHAIDSWRSNLRRPTERNRAMDIAAQVSSRVIIPQIFAQNSEDQEDRESASIMRQLMEWTLDDSDYDRTQFYGVINALFSPATIIHTEYNEKYKKQELADGSEQWVLDEEMTGFKETVVPVNEFFIENIYEHDIQNQGHIIWRRILSRSSAKRKYGQMPNWKYVGNELQTKFDPATNTFYDIYDDSLTGDLVEEVIYWNKDKDVKLIMVNGVLMTPHDNPNPRQDKKYPFWKFGYELIDGGKFFYYKSVTFKMMPDARAINEFWNDAMDASKLNTNPPVFVIGENEIESSVLAPGAVTVFNDSQTQVSPMNFQTNPNAALQALRELEVSIAQSTATPPATATQGLNTAFEVATVQQNAIINLGLFAKLIGYGVEDFGRMRVADILQYLTIADVMEVVEGETRVKFKSFLLPEKSIDGKTKTAKIRFTLGQPYDMETGKQLSKEQIKLMESLRIMNEENAIKNESRIYEVNPTLFRQMKYRVKIQPELVTPPSDAQKRQEAISMYQLFRPDPLFDAQALVRNIVLPTFKETAADPDSFLAQPQTPGGELDQFAQAQPQGEVETEEAVEAEPELQA